MKTPIWIALSLVWSLSAYAQEGFDEIFDKNGELRAPYEYVYPMWGERYSNHEENFLRKSRKAFRGDNALDSMPRVLSEEEFQVLKSGVEQRAQAITRFLQDHYSGRKSYTRMGLPKSLVDRIIARSGETGYANYIDPSKISFFYGPDVIRDSQGQWRVIEDNLGFVGGFGDLLLANKYMLKAYPELEQYLNIRNPMAFFQAIAEQMKREAEKHGGRAILFKIGDYASDNEEKRISEIFEKLGISTVTPRTKNKLVFEKDALFVRGENGRREKVGFVFLNAEHSWTDPMHLAAYPKYLTDEAYEALMDKDLKPELREHIAMALQNVDPKTHLPDFDILAHLLRLADVGIDFLAHRNHGLLDLILRGKVGTNYTPGVDFVGDKEFYVFVEDLIRFYLKQEPIIKNIPTERFAKAGQLDQALVRKVFGQMEKYVVKKVNGRGGDSVWVGGKITPEEKAELLKLVTGNPDLFIVQEFTPLSRLNNNIIDQRLLSYVTPEKTYVADVPWGRGVPASGNGKVNLSDRGREIAILVASPKLLMCRQLF